MLEIINFPIFINIIIIIRENLEFLTKTACLGSAAGTKSLKQLVDCSIFQVAVAVWIHRVLDCVLHQVIKSNINSILMEIVYFN